jgi:hypothetical protein
MTARFDVAHIRQQGIDLIIIPLTTSFGSKSPGEQDDITRELQLRARSAGLAGTVVPVWDNGGGRMGFLAPPAWHPFFSSLTLHDVASNVNRGLICN